MNVEFMNKEAKAIVETLFNSELFIEKSRETAGEIADNWVKDYLKEFKLPYLEYSEEKETLIIDLSTDTHENMTFLLTDVLWSFVDDHPEDYGKDAPNIIRALRSLADKIEKIGEAK